MFKKEDETFKEYAQRWRDLAAQVAPPMVEREMITMMVDTLPVFYYEKLVGYCRNLPFGGRATRDSRDACSTKGIRAESPPTFI